MEEEFPHLNQSFSYNKNSLILQNYYKNPNFKMTIEILEGNRVMGNNEGAVAFKDLGSPDKLYNWIKMSLANKYVMMRPSDNSIERFITLPTGIFDGLTKDIFINYLRDEMSFAADIGNFRFSNFKGNRENNIVMDIISASEKHNMIPVLMKQAIKDNSVEEFIKDNKAILGEIITEYINSRVSEVQATLNKYKIKSFESDEVFKFVKIIIYLQ